ncbi:MAG: type transport system ATP-binding protein [Frankiales bacterium]|jgi:ABC-2 type transport system ATP-binding protein|nr:type transport system ATP-binding protein [Frankiales bacterium]MDX6214194.1 type transport system ATP-binding protein [Frankiales bacterium]
MSTPIVRVSDVSKKFNIHKDKNLKERVVNAGRSRKHAEEFWALRDISFELEAGKTLGLIGHNGSGKSTLLKIIGGILTPNTGYVERRGRLAALLELGAGFHGDLTGRENVYLNASILGLSRKQTEMYFDEIVDFSGIEQFIDTQVKFYSSGMYVRLAFSVAVHVDPEILLIDEVLAVGDEPFQKKCLDKIRAFQRDGRTIVFVTHGLDVVRALCDRAIMLDKGTMAIDGTPTDVLRAFRDQYSVEAAPEAERGDKRIEIGEVLVQDAAGVERNRFVPGDNLVIDIELEAHEQTDDWNVGIAIFNKDDILVYGTNTHVQLMTLAPFAPGRKHVRFAFDDIALTESQYYCTVAVHPTNGPEYHRLERKAAFRVYTASHDEGLLYLTPKIEVLDT